MKHAVCGPSRNLLCNPDHVSTGGILCARKDAEAGIATLYTAVCFTSCATLPSAMSLDSSLEVVILAKISSALAVLEHRRGSALIPAACARKECMHGCRAALPVTPRHCDDAQRCADGSTCGRFEPDGTAAVGEHCLMYTTGSATQAWQEAPTTPSSVSLSGPRQAGR